MHHRSRPVFALKTGDQFRIFLKKGIARPWATVQPESQPAPRVRKLLLWASFIVIAVQDNMGFAVLHKQILVTSKSTR